MRTVAVNRDYSLRSERQKKPEKGEQFMPSASSRVTTDHEEIRRWAEERGGAPSHVKRTGREDDPGILRIDFPGYSGAGSLEPLSWDQWFQKFDEQGLALLFQETTANGQPSNFNKIVSRETVNKAESGRGHRAASRGSRSNARSAGTRSSSSGGSRSRRASSSSSNSGNRSRRASSTSSRNQNRSEGRSSRKKTTARTGEVSGRTSSRSASTRSSSARGKGVSSSKGRAGETGTRTSRGNTSRRSSSGMRASKSRSAQAKSRSAG